MDMKKIKIGDRIFDVVKLDEYAKHKDAYLNGYIAIGDLPETDMVLPVKNQNDTGPGLYVGSTVSYGVFPTQDDPDYEEYLNSNIIDFGNSETMKEIIEKQESIRKLEKEILSSPDNLFKPKISPDDASEMIALKQAVDMKNIDLDKYEPRFGANYNNDKRLFNKNTISLAMTKRLCNALDIKATLTLEDKDDDVPNPMGDKIVVELTGGGDDDE